MKANHHYDYAVAAAGAANSHAEQEFNDAVRSDALIHATLALAYEQRTTNLIAWFGDGTHGDASKELHAAIIERLGLSE